VFPFIGSRVKETKGLVLIGDSKKTSRITHNFRGVAGTLEYLKHCCFSSRHLSRCPECHVQIVFDAPRLIS